METKAKRLDSLDMMRGFIMLSLILLCPLLRDLAKAAPSSVTEFLAYQCNHSPWAHIRFFDLIMPMFVFMSGCAIPYAFAKYRESDMSRSKIYLRILRRVILLWILGMVCQGNLCSFNPSTFKYFSNTLQSIAVGYAVSALLFLNTRPRTQIIVACVLPLIYWAGCEFVTVDGFGGGSYAVETNFPRWVDMMVLGKGESYTWVFSSLNFVVTAMTGMFAGEILKGKADERRKMLTLLLAGVGMIAAGLLWSIWMPIVKHIWSSSMTLVTSGISFLFICFFYYYADFRHFKGLGWLKVLGVNCMLAYLLHYFPLTSITGKLLWGLSDIVGPDWYRIILCIADFALLWVLLKMMYKHKIYFRV